MTTFRVFSDLHADVNKHHTVVEEMANEENQILLFAGDLAPTVSHTFYERLPELCERFKQVVFVPGNHEFYGSRFMSKNGLDFTEKNEKFNNLTVLGFERKSMVIDDIKIIGVPLWTDFFNQDPDQIINGVKSMNDFRMIRSWKNESMISPDEIIEASYDDKAIIEDMLRINECENTIVMTHHAPSTRSVDPFYQGSPLNGFFVNEYDDVIHKNTIDYWIHGHTHATLDYEHFNTRVICNPYGYRNENPKFQHDLTIKV